MSPPLRVMHLLLEFSYGGAEVGVLKLANGFDRSRIQPSICSFGPPDRLLDLLGTDVPFFELPRRAAGNDIGLVFRLARLLRRERIQLLHTHGWGTLCEGVAAARLARVPLVVHGEHGTIEERPRNRWVQRVVWGRCDGVLSVSSRLAAKLSDVVGFPESRITTIRNGVDTVRFKPTRIQGQQRPFTIGAVGRLVEVKNHRLLLRGLAMLRSRGLSFQARIVGSGPLHDSLQKLISDLDLTHVVTLDGERPNIEQILGEFDVFVSSSTSEGLSNSILEAMASGLPVVATDVGGTDELVRDGVNGFLVPSNDPDALASALGNLQQDVLRREEIGRAARHRAETEFSLAGMVRGYEDYYCSLASKRRVY